MILLFFDGQCGLCSRTVQFVIKRDTQKRFRFASLQGLTAKQLLPDLLPEQERGESLILIEEDSSANRKIYRRSKGAFRLCWLLGGWWKIPGLLSFLPGSVFDWAYKIVAKNRYRFSKSCLLNHDDRFLP